MPRRVTNLLLLVLVVAEAATGLIGWAVHGTVALPLYELHRALGVALVLLLLWKQEIVRASLARRLPHLPIDRSVVPGALAGIALMSSLLVALAWTLQLVSFDAFWGYSALNVHVLLALGALPFFVAHLARRWEHRPPARQLVTRRTALQLLGLGVAATVVWQLGERVAAAAAAGTRRPSGSKHAGSFTANEYPVTIWTFDAVPELDPATWRLGIVGNVASPVSLSYEDLLRGPIATANVVLDCTGGWWSEQRWTGRRLGDLLATVKPHPAARWAEVVSVTGHQWTFTLSELASALIATHVGGEPLTPGHGFPARLVVEGRRGFQWVKWVDHIRVL